MERKKIGLALSGGGARGFAHVGVLKVLAEYNIPVDMIAGTSAGSVVGAAFAAGMSPDEIETMSRKVRWANMTRPSLSPLGLLSNVPMGNFIRREFPVHDFEDLTIPFAAVAYDLINGEEMVFKDRGDLVFAVRASCAVPAVFRPLHDDGRVLVDGGVTSPLPVDVVRGMGADIVIAVDLLACGATFRTMPRTAVAVLLRSALTVIRSASKNQQYRPDITIEPAIAHLRPDQVGKRIEFIALGEAAARSRIEQILDLTQ